MRSDLCVKLIDIITVLSSVEIICCHEKLKTQVCWYVHISYTIDVSILLIVIEIFDNFLKDDPTQVFEMTDTALSFTEIVCDCQLGLSA